MNCQWAKPQRRWINRVSLLRRKFNWWFDDDGYLKNEIQWNLQFNYSVRYGYNLQKFDKEKMEFKGLLTHSLGFSGSIQPTKNWNFTFNTDYNFDLKKFTSINCSLTRNLHCWSMSASFIPIGHKSIFVIACFHATS